MTCPGCRGEMTGHTLESHTGTPVTIDLCATCQACWFDGLESLRLAPRSVLALFRVIGEHTTRPPESLSRTAACPTCGMRLVPTSDRQRSTRFEYLRCPQRHGRLITFFNFLREKDFIRPLSGAQLAELRRNVEFVNCSNCGAPVDLGKGSACAHCGSPLSMLDLKQAEALVAQLEGAGRKGERVDPTLPLQLEHSRREVESAFAAFDRETGWGSNVTSLGLVGAALKRWLTGV